MIAKEEITMVLFSDMILGAALSLIGFSVIIVISKMF